MLPLIDVSAHRVAATRVLTPERASEMARTFKAISDPTRLRLITMIAGHQNAEACVCDLTAPLDLGQPTVSHHLKILVEAGILKREQRGTWAYYTLVHGALDSLAQLLVSLESASPIAGGNTTETPNP
ncbi:metalloregulator ArsR/SmtB family transcription factor [Cryobacterium sp. CG_9.6]|uniref:ArsR/SmtB family transcription factor n=1 Tax=Cryobacterium sp. CG_9.6 TaxID=2760710 RepID=UPI0024734F81|nr:metalloregulator ArsR/SmtB family transcription factor [Cryobacterium sp. CG_9.6]